MPAAPDSTASFALIVTLALVAAVLATLEWSRRNPDRSIWPPTRFTMRTRTVTWTITVLALGAGFYAALAGADAWDWPVWLRYGIGLPLMSIGSSIASWAIVSLGFDQSMGARDDLKTDGLFARSRNPTYAGNIMLLVGLVLFAANTTAVIVALALGLLYAIAPSYEEPWLKRLHGAAYDRYREQVRRWL